LSSKARRPYLMGKRSLTEFYSSPARYLKEIVGKESEFEKPYEEEEYRKMHFDFPWPDWPPFPDLPPLPDIPGGPVPGLSLCAITCYKPLDCDEPIWCHPSIWCGEDLMCNLCNWTVEGATSGFTPHPFGGSVNKSWGIDIWIDATLTEAGGEALIHVQMKDPCGNLCGEDIEVICKKCPPDVVMTWDTVNSAETIAADSTVGVYVADGLGPYTWSVVGTGFSMLNPTTETVYNTLVAAVDACGSATITVTDFCGDSVVGYVRCTTGTWNLNVGQCVGCQPAGIGIECPGTGCATCTAPAWIVEGKYRWRLSAPFEYYAGYPGCPPIWRNPPVAYCPGAPCSEPPPPCGSPVECAEGTPCVAGRVCYVRDMAKDEWIC